MPRVISARAPRAGESLPWPPHLIPGGSGGLAQGSEREPRPGDPKQEGLERVKEEYEETVFRQLKSMLEKK